MVKICNREFAEHAVDPGSVPFCTQDLLYDPQTSGGLLMAVHPDDADALFSEMAPLVPCAQRVGTVREFQGGKRIFFL